MSAPRRFGFLDFVLLVLVIAGAGGARAWYLLNCANKATTCGPLQVQDEQPKLTLNDPKENKSVELTDQDQLVKNLKEHRWFGGVAPFASQEEQTAHTSPGYPWLRYWLTQIPGVTVDDAKVRWIQCSLGALTAGLYFLFARRAFRSRLVGLLAGGLCAVHPFWIIDTAELNDGVLASFALAGCLFLGSRGGEKGGALTSLLYGLGLAGLALVRAALLPFSVVALLWFLRRCRKVAHGWLCGIVALLGFAIGLTPWTLRNYQVFHEPIPIVDSAFLHLWIGNNPHAHGGPLSDDPRGEENQVLTSLWEARHQKDEGLTIEQLKKDLAEKAQPQRYMELGKDVLEEVRKDPAATAERRIWAGLDFFFGASFFKNGQLWREQTGAEEVTMPDWLGRSYRGILYGSLLGMLVLGVLGWRWTYAWRHLALPSSLAVVWIPLPYILGHAESLAGPRLPLDGVLLSYAAFALVCLVPGKNRALFQGPIAETQVPLAAPVAAAPRPVPPPVRPVEPKAPAGYQPKNPFA